jgi:hypothetical protein
LRTRVAEALRGNSASFSCAANLSSGGAVRSIATAFSLARRTATALASLIRLAFFSIELFFAT